MEVYFDNAATTALDPKVIDEMMPILQEYYGNPSSIHAQGRKVKAKLELCRRKVAELLNVTPSEIVFTSGGTEADNIAIRSSIKHLGIKHAITSDIEHHAVLDTMEEVCDDAKVKLSKVKFDQKGIMDLKHLEELLKSNEKSFVSLMHANNELGNLTDLEKVGNLCSRYNAIFHSDTVQTMAHYACDFDKLNVHFATCSAHKFHGPKGIGFLYVNKKVNVPSLFRGGGQERGNRPGTENIYGIVGLTKALEIGLSEADEHEKQIKSLKYYMMEALEKHFPEVEYNGDPKGDSLYTVLNVSLPPSDKANMLLFNLDLAGISASGGSACTSGASTGSHVLSQIQSDPNRPAIRFSFSKYNTTDEVDYVIQKLREFYQ